VKFRAASGNALKIYVLKKEHLEEMHKFRNAFKHPILIQRI
jgi:hypothetical protein